MGFKCGIVGLPNVGKSTLFNALTNSSKAQAENFPFCTIDPNIGIVPVPDERLEKLVSISKSAKKIHTTISFVDIAGLVKGASKGEGLGNKFIETEMKLADLESIEKRLDKKNKKNLDENIFKILEKAKQLINNDNDLDILKNEYDERDLKQCTLLSTKPKLYICNVDEQSIEKGNGYTEKFIAKYGEKSTIIISAEIENQINQLGDKIEKEKYMQMINMKETGLNNLIKKGYDLLSLETFFTSGPEESRAWTITKNCTAPKAAGEIHTDFEKGFIRAETVSYKDFVDNEGWLKARESGKMRLEGKDYIVNDGDVLNFRFNT